MICSFHIDRHIKFHDFRKKNNSPVLLSSNFTAFTTAHLTKVAKHITKQVTIDTIEKKTMSTIKILKVNTFFSNIDDMNAAKALPWN